MSLRSLISFATAATLLFLGVGFYIFTQKRKVVFSEREEKTLILILASKLEGKYHTVGDDRLHSDKMKDWNSTKLNEGEKAETESYLKRLK